MHRECSIQRVSEYSQSGNTSRAAAVPSMNHASMPLPCPLVALRYICGIQNEYSAKRKKGRTEGARMYWNAIHVRMADIKTLRQYTLRARLCLLQSTKYLREVYTYRIIEVSW